MYDKEYRFKVYYRVKGAKKRNSRFIKISRFHDLRDAWHMALATAIANTQDWEIIDSIEIVES